MGLEQGKSFFFSRVPAPTSAGDFFLCNKKKVSMPPMVLDKVGLI
jgi:hypothetical protein